MGVAWPAQLKAASGFTIAGCVTDSTGKPVGRAKVIAVRFDAENTYIKKADTKKETGCYEMRNVREGIYWIIVKDDRVEGDTFSPVQTKVRLLSKSVDQVNLTTEVPNRILFQEDITRALKSARGGFPTEKDADVPSAWGDGGTGLPARIFSGFRWCTIHYVNDADGPTAAEWCKLAWLKNKKETEAALMFSAMQASIRSSTADVPGFHYREAQDNTSPCGNCINETVWLSPTNGVISLRLVREKYSLTLELWIIYNQRVVARACTATARGMVAQIDSQDYETSWFRIIAETESTMREQLRVAQRNLLRLLLVGGALETAPTPVALTEFPISDASTSCVQPN
jgi:hypothetical protein